MVEDLIFKLINLSAFASGIAKYDNNPAVFYQSAANDLDPRWGAKQYPRLDYNVDWTYSPERKTAGTMTVNIWCTNEDEAPPEDLGKQLVDDISETFLTDTSGTYCIIWTRSDSFDGAGTKEPKIIGITCSFDVIAFPSQITTTPDPVEGLNLYAKALVPAAMIIGTDTLPEIWKPAIGTPAIYWRNTGMSINPTLTTNAVAWIDGNISGHVISPDPQERQNIIRQITNDMALNQEVVLTDFSPMLLQRLTYNLDLNPIRDGQISLTGRYGVLRQYPVDPPLNNINVSRKTMEG